MERFFLEEVDTQGVLIAAIDRHRIFQAENPGLLATPFHYSTDPTREDDAQLFYALGQSIGADQFFIDLTSSHRSHKLNVWSIGIVDKSEANIFKALTPLDHQQRLKLYGSKRSITPLDPLDPPSNDANMLSVSDLVQLSEQSQWKTGLLQRCIDALVKKPHRGKAEVYAIIDRHYRQLIRYKVETEEIALGPNTSLLLIIRGITSNLSLKDSHDTKVFSTIPKIVDHLLFPFFRMIGRTAPASLLERLSQTLTLWSGARVIKVDNGFQVEVDKDISRALDWMQPWLHRPKSLLILETPF